MTTAHAFPSIEKILVTLLKEQTGVHVVTETPANFESPTGPTSGLPLIAVDRIAGANLIASPAIDRPVIDVDCYDTSREGAQTLAEHVRQYLYWTLPGSRVDGVVFSATRTIVGPRLLAHANPAIRRYSANYELLMHAQP